MAVVLRKAGIPPGQSRIELERAAASEAAADGGALGVGGESAVFAARNFIPANGKRRGNRDRDRRAAWSRRVVFVLVAAGLIGWRAHQEITRRNKNEFRAFGAITEDFSFSGLQPDGSRASPRQNIAETFETRLSRLASLLRQRRQRVPIGHGGNFWQAVRRCILAGFRRRFRHRFFD
jgi:hypothetical protein